MDDMQTGVSKMKKAAMLVIAAFFIFACALFFFPDEKTNWEDDLPKATEEVEKDRFERRPKLFFHPGEIFVQVDSENVTPEIVMAGVQPFQFEGSPYTFKEGRCTNDVQCIVVMDEGGFPSVARSRQFDEYCQVHVNPEEFNLKYDFYFRHGWIMGMGQLPVPLMTHEVGHCLGLEHPLTDLSADIFKNEHMTPVMYTGRLREDGSLSDYDRQSFDAMLEFYGVEVQEPE